MDGWPLRGVEVPGLQRGQKCVGFVSAGLHHHPAAKRVGADEMRIVHRDEGDAAPFGQELVGEIDAVTALGPQLRRVVVDLHRMRAFKGIRIGRGKRIPARMGDGYERTGGDGTGSQLRSRFTSGGLREIAGQAYRQDVPHLAQRRRWRVQLGTQDRGKIVGAEGSRIDDRKIVLRQEMIRQCQEIVACLAIGRADLLGRADTVGSVGMGMDVALPEAAGRGESVVLRPRFLSCCVNKFGLAGAGSPGCGPQQGGGVGVGRIAKDRLGLPGFKDTPALHHGHAPRHSPHHGQVVRD